MINIKNILGIEKSIPQKIKRVLKKVLGKPVLRIIMDFKKAKLLREIVKDLKRKNISYSFSKQDIDLFVLENYVTLPSIRENSINVDNLLIEYFVNGIRIWWPQNISPKDLPCLYHEVFDSFVTNPSSYDHPRMEFSNANWILDGGAGEGFFSVFALKKTTANILAVEPLPQMRVPLSLTLNIYANERRFSIITAALGVQPGSCEVLQDNDHVCNTTVSIRDGTHTMTNNSVPMITIDQIVNQHDLKGHGIIKMDIEGFEMNALRGATMVLKELKPNLAVAVYHGLNNANECASIIRKANPTYKIEFRGMYGYYKPPRPYLLFAY